VTLLALARYNVTHSTLAVGGHDMLKDLRLAVAVMFVAQMVPIKGPCAALTATVRLSTWVHKLSDLAQSCTAATSA
jgi:hypothetical protein